MNANPNLLHKKYSRIVELLAKKLGIGFDAALDLFYKSETYKLVSDGVSDMHCMSDEYLVSELMNEYSVEE